MATTALILGGTGFLGSAIGERLAALGWKLNLVTRDANKRLGQTSYPCNLYEWHNGRIPEAAWKDIDAVINLVGQPIFDQAWTSSYKKLLLASRLNSVRALRHAIQDYNHTPAVIIQASAVGFYGYEATHSCDEHSPAGADFLADVCSTWETEAASLARATRLVTPRLGVVLGWGGGAWPELHKIYASGLGAILASGKQWMNWVHLDDVVNFVAHALENSSYSGVYNLTAPANSTNREFHTALCKSSASLTWLKLPAPALFLGLGQRAKYLIHGPQIRPTRLLTEQFPFRIVNINDALESLISSNTRPRVHVLHAKQWLPISQSQTWEFMSSAANLEAITPPWLSFKFLKSSTPNLQAGTRLDYQLKLHGISLRWCSILSDWQPKSGFVDEQLHGPYRSWRHNHMFLPLAGGTLIQDFVEYELPFFPLSLLALPMVANDLKKIFEFRRQKIAEVLVS